MERQHINHLETEHRLLFLKTQFVLCSKHLSSRLQNRSFTMYGVEVAVCSQTNTTHINTVWAESTIIEC